MASEACHPATDQPETGFDELRALSAIVVRIGAGFFEQTPVLGFYREGAALSATYDAII